ncbi:uncharacterized protein LOC123544152 [Mercenaria mercenaria]|uniref:uncharacterized protein LOC123544152 n=1 Tax=Mercenaria mercenaria TaxID=6596 RepID=UPI00234E5CC0|nr:uncharacterized protein LOC123544152 [Mercenaria mercenaria]
MRMHVHAYLLFCVILFARQLEGLADTSATLDNNKDGNKIEDGNPHVTKKSDTIKFEGHQENKVEKQNCTIWFNMTGLINMARSISLSSVDNMQNIAYKILQTYNNLFNIYTKRARAISGQMQINKQRLNKLEQDLDSLVEELYQKYETSDPDMKPVVKILLEKALDEREKLSRKKATEYSILECSAVMGTNCDTDDDCYGKGCLLQCKTSGYLWWWESVCR